MQKKTVQQAGRGHASLLAKAGVCCAGTKGTKKGETDQAVSFSQLYSITLQLQMNSIDLLHKHGIVLFKKAAGERTLFHKRLQT
jgi:hypothetical protein